MNIAIIFAGQLRWFDLTHSTFKTNFAPLLEGHSVHYFGHFWPSEPNPENVANQFAQIYSPLIFDTESQRSSSYIRGFFDNQISINGSLPSQSFSFYKAFLLLREYQIQNNIEFDLHIRLRSDLIFLDPLRIDNFDNDSIYVRNVSHWRPLSSFVSDYIFFSRSFSNIQKLANMGFYFDEITSNPETLLYQNDYKNNIFCPEELLAKYLVSQNIPIKTFDFNIDLARHHR